LVERSVAKALFAGSLSYGGGSGIGQEVARCSDSPVKESDMGLGDKIENMKDDLTGKGKEATGKATDNERLEAEGRVDQSEADLKQAGEKVKDAFKN
jgi:uncharacterized protein YjbJ (UPF0337 family)